MSTCEEQFYETASRELAENKLSEAIWAKAFSLAVADEQIAKALYIKLRVEQLDRERPRSTAEAIREAWPAITSGQAFICPHCGAHAAAQYAFWISSMSLHFYCRTCKKELYAEAPKTQTTVATTRNDPFPSDVPMDLVLKVNNPWALWGFIVGLVSVFFFWIGIIPLIGLVLSVIGLTSFKPESQKNKWMAGVGLCLSIIYTLMSMREYGHLG